MMSGSVCLVCGCGCASIAHRAQGGLQACIETLQYLACRCQEEAQAVVDRNYASTSKHVCINVGMGINVRHSL